MLKQVVRSTVVGVASVGTELAHTKSILYANGLQTISMHCSQNFLPRLRS